ncbi:complex I subunit 5 family protein [Halapricum desulfuricans]|uniref:complex I subunit 5 family protein n=1 Tax=Halapricum desulfuricans TaxID=2841257 RepID=UPI001E643317|nr:proton-conducting transporter membrane subunit [Halapricum desulfuricans]
MSLLPVAVVVAPAAAVPPILYFRDRPNVREAWTFAAALATLGAAGWLASVVLAGARPDAVAGTYVAGVELSLRADPMGAMFALLAATLWLVTSVYSVGYMRGHDEASQGRYFAAFAASIAATMGVALAANLLTLFVCYELLTVATYPLVVHSESDEARAAGRTYLLYTLGGGVAVLAGLSLVYVAAGTLAFVPGGVGGLAADPLLARAAFGLLVAGFGVKAALVPLHTWLPAAMVAPTPVSGLLHAVAVVKSGAFGLGRVVTHVYGPETVADLGLSLPLSTLAAVTMLYAGVVALRQTRIKRALAYSTVSQLAYIALGFGLVERTATFGALLHIPAHAFMKITLFFVAGLLYVESGVTDVDDMDGIGRRHPVAMAAFAVTAAGLAGFPLVAGFVSKWHLLIGSFRADALVFAAALLAAGVLKLLLFWPMIRAAFFRGDPLASGPARDKAGRTAADGGAPDGEPSTSTARSSRSGPAGARAWEAPSRIWRESAPALLAPVVAVALGAIVLGIVPDRLPLFDLAAEAVAEVFG